MKPTRSILLTDEDAATRGFLADNLTADGYRVLVADDTPAALDLLEPERPDLVVSNVNGDTLGLLERSANRTASPAGSRPARR
jgi:DNA-binding response OmpR family regulator